MLNLCVRAGLEDFRCVSHLDCLQVSGLREVELVAVLSLGGVLALLRAYQGPDWCRTVWQDCWGVGIRGYCATLCKIRGLGTEQSKFDTGGLDKLLLQALLAICMPISPTTAHSGP